MRAEIITIGDELLIGQTVDTNSAWIGAELSRIGFEMRRITSISDNHHDILNALSVVAGQCEVVMITGGLGPTSDDITKSSLCEFFGTTLRSDSQVLKMIEEMLSRRGLPMNDNNRKQAEVPASCRVLPNAAGTAPGMWFEKQGTIFISMPGVPYEMKHIMTEHVLPELSKRFGSQVIIHRNLMTYGTFEAMLAEILIRFESELPGSVKLAYLPSFGVIKLRLTGKGSSRQEVEKEVEEQVRKLYAIIPQYIYGEDEESMEMAIGRMLSERKRTLSICESCTGGRIAHLITSVPGSSKYFRGSIVAYANEIKSDIVGVPSGLIAAHGAVSRECVERMASETRKLFSSDYCIATSGIAGPDGGTAEKPVGTVWIAVASAEKTISEMYVFSKDRMVNISRTSVSALDMLRRVILGQ